jgi:hypothetical protein
MDEIPRPFQDLLVREQLAPVLAEKEAELAAIVANRPATLLFPPRTNAPPISLWSHSPVGKV